VTDSFKVECIKVECRKGQDVATAGISLEVHRTALDPAMGLRVYLAQWR
jgi:hypothetical protein